jgi:cell division protein FtsW (lipid II flippase)
MTAFLLGIGGLLASILRGLLSQQIAASIPRWCSLIVTAATRLLPAAARDRYREEWLGEIDQARTLPLTCLAVTGRITARILLMRRALRTVAAQELVSVGPTRSVERDTLVASTFALLAIGTYVQLAAPDRNIMQSVPELAATIFCGLLAAGVVLGFRGRVGRRPVWPSIGVGLGLGVLQLTAGLGIGLYAWTATRGTSIFGLLIQTAPIAVGLTLAAQAYGLSRPASGGWSFHRLVGLSVPVFVTFYLLMRQEDVVWALMLLLATVILWLAVGVPIRLIVGIAAAGCGPLMWRLGASSTFVFHASTLFHPSPYEASGVDFQQVQSLAMFKHGAIFGHSALAIPLPEAERGYAIAAVFYRYGAAVGLTILLLYALSAWCVVRMTLRSTSHYQRLVCLALGLVIALPALIHLAVCTGVVPVPMSVPLPLISESNGMTIAALVAIAGMLRVSKPRADGARQTIARSTARSMRSRRRLARVAIAAGTICTVAVASSLYSLSGIVVVRGACIVFLIIGAAAIVAVRMLGTARRRVREAGTQKCFDIERSLTI